MENSEMAGVKKYDKKIYYETYVKKHDSTTRTTCDVCGGIYSYFNRTHHNNTKKHIHTAELILKLKEQLAGKCI